MLLAVLDDSLGEGRPDPVEAVELLDGGGGEAEPGAAAGAAPGAEPAAAAPRRGTSTCWPSCTFIARLTAERSAPRAGPPARSIAVAIRDPARSR